MSHLHVILRRAFGDEFQPWQKIDFANNLQAAKKRVSKLTGEPGDLILVLSVDHISDIQEKARIFYLVGQDGSIRLVGNVPSELHSNSWLSGWEGSDADACDMLNACYGVPQKTIVRACLACIQPIFDVARDNDQLIQESMSAVEAYLDGHGDRVESANDAAMYLMEKRAYRFSSEKVKRTITAMYYLTLAAKLKSSASANASGAVYSVAASTSNKDEMVKLMSSSVRRIIPIVEIMKYFLDE